MHTTSSPSSRIGPARRALGGLAALVATLVWTHALTGLARAAAGLPAATLAPRAAALSLSAVAVALAGASAVDRPRLAALRAGLAGTLLGGALALGSAADFVPGLALVLAGVPVAALAACLALRLPSALDALPHRHPRMALAWLALALLAVVQVGRLSTYMTDRGSDWFVSTRHPFYAHHECIDAYVYAAELDAHGEENVYDPAHYPGLAPNATPYTEMVGMSPEDPYQYPPQFLLLPRLAIELTHDFDAIRSVWFGLNVTLCLAAVLALALWVGGRVGTTAGLLSPALLASFPVLHNFQYGQFHFAAVALAVLAMLALERRRAALGGGLLATAILAKMFPALLVIPLVVRRRWRALGWTAGVGGVLTALALAVLGPDPFTAFVSFHLPRLADGRAFAFDEAWPDLAGLVVAANQGVPGIVHKLATLGATWADASFAHLASRAFALGLVAVAFVVGRHAARASRVEHALTWLGLLGLGSLASPGAWADYVPLTCVWLLAFLLARVRGRRIALGAWTASALLQVTVLGGVPLGPSADPAWMVPVSLVGSLAMLATFSVGALARPATRTETAIAEQPRGASATVGL